MTQNEHVEQPLPNYRVIQLHGPQRGNQPVDDLEGLVTHHPGANARARVDNGVPVGVENAQRRSYGVIGGKIEELETRRTDGGRTSALGEDQVLLTKDFILEDSRVPAGGRGVRQVDVPSPFAGYIQRVSTGMGTVDIYDREGGELMARVLHLEPIHVSAGDTIAYGQALGIQSNQGLPHAGKHVHIEVDTRYYQEFDHYVGDLTSGRLSIDPVRRNVGIAPRPVVDDGIIRVGESSEFVRIVQQRLNAQGYQGNDNQPLAEDGVYRLAMQRAVINYQEATGLRVTGDLDPATVMRIAPSIFPPLVNPGEVRDLPPYLDFHGQSREAPGAGLLKDPLLAQARDAMQRMEAGLGRGYDVNSERMAASAACLAKRNGLTRIDHVMVSLSAAAARQGEHVFVVQGNPGDPAHRRAHMPTAEALSTPVEASVRRLQEPELESIARNQQQESELPVQGENHPARVLG